MDSLTENVLAFAELLRSEYAIPAGHDRAYEALRALEVALPGSRERARYALRSVFCSKQDELERFDRAFDAFFQADPHLRRVRRLQSHPDAARHRDRIAVARREPLAERPGEAAHGILHARYSPSASAANARAAVASEGLAATSRIAARLIAELHLGRSRRWKPHPHGSRFDLRHTLRASLQTGGDPARIRTLGHPLRNPRIVVLIDASRSMSDYTPGLIQFAFAICRRTHRARAFVFSTDLREITRDLRAAPPNGERGLAPLGEAWGGGTRLGTSLHRFARAYAPLLEHDTLVIVASDGLDTGEIALIRSAMHTIHRRCAGIIWLNPHAGTPGFEPAAAGMRAALPYVSALVDAKRLDDAVSAVRRLRG